MTQQPSPNRRGFLTLIAVAALPGAVWAEGAPILTVIDAAGHARTFDEAAFAALLQHELVTHTVWTEGVQTFRGVRLSDVLALVGSEADLRGRTLSLKALNDYTIDIPAADAWTYGTILARQQNGITLSRRDKGPLWLVYPRDADDVLRDQRYDSRWVWQLSEIGIK